MFTAFAGGAFLLVTGTIGYDIRSLHGLFQGGKWASGPVWSQILLGLALLSLSYYWWRRLSRSLSLKP